MQLGEWRVLGVIRAYVDGVAIEQLLLCRCGQHCKPGRDGVDGGTWELVGMWSGSAVFRCPCSYRCDAEMCKKSLHSVVCENVAVCGRNRMDSRRVRDVVFGRLAHDDKADAWPAVGTVHWERNGCSGLP